ncbi:50S ribosomal protein L4 [Desulfurispira natronophila]|uniref:Large ribosomal subunit protein uL4 n=1 Tax=Desulfurispira natronophila TaxID=682562 RepID=A0A7W7Y5E2_9BACT|nr:50S ribosomal protein L4 [Desulfurispira natronophila]MBB5022406.1 large subunit ribosomal protein L4 [Desulfurispira natronophila]
MPVVSVINVNNEKVGEVSLSDTLFGGQVKPHLMHEMVVAQLAARRQGTHAVKNRSAVSGGGAKPWRQKGTGRARAGTSRSPLWRTGGVIFGPTPRSYAKKVNKKVRHLALVSALSEKAAQESVVVFDEFALEAPKTKLANAVFQNCSLDRKVLFVVEELDSPMALAMRNLPYVKLIKPEGLNVYDVVNARVLAFEKATAERLNGEVQ